MSTKRKSNKNNNDSATVCVTLLFHSRLHIILFWQVISLDSECDEEEEDDSKNVLPLGYIYIDILCLFASLAFVSKYI